MSGCKFGNTIQYNTIQYNTIQYKPLICNWLFFHCKTKELSTPIYSMAEISL
ncbi:hypothetical protein [Brachyspira aalborgi]|uniref:hypothetical protein n=1 Tax=Brachyspira aalborgi TaxID=29522 RepID=UPI001315A0D3|nr:hypothetical protein [Brachyspira aalborgi]